MNVVSCFRRPSSKETQSPKPNTLIHNTVRMEEKYVVDGRASNDKGGYSFIDDATIVKCFRF